MYKTEVKQMINLLHRLFIMLESKGCFFIPFHACQRTKSSNTPNHLEIDPI